MPNPASANPRRFVLLDRDGTLNVDKDYISDPDLVELIPGAAEGLRRLQRLGCGLVVVTNQSGIGRGWITTADLQRVHARLQELLAQDGVTLDAIYHCPHVSRDNCPCRKPRTGLAEQARAAFGFNPHRSFVIGDKRSDIDLGRAIGAATFLVRTGYGATWERDPELRVDHVVDDLGAAAELIERIISGTP